jgi:hypothetical protein
VATLSGSTSKDEPAPAPVGADEARADAVVELGAYRDDPRVRTLAAGWADRVERALERVETVTGLSFRRTAPPRVVLAPLRDEERVHALDSEIAGGRRRSVVRVNVEVLAAGRGDPDLVLLHALAAAALDDPVAHPEPVPRWTALAAGLAAGGNLSATLRRIADRAARGVAGATDVDPSRAESAEPTAAAAILLLLGRGDPAAMRTYFSFVGDGDPPGALLARTIEDPEGQWAGAGRAALEDAIRDQPPSPWDLLADADRLLQEQGRAALLASLPDPVPAELAAEVRLLRARGAEAEGDYEAVRRELLDLPPGSAARVRDPAELARLLAEAERRAGDPDAARRLEEQLLLDYPRAARAAGRAASGERNDPEGAEGDLRGLEERIRTLLRDHRVGAAERLLDAAGDRGLAPELAGVSREIVEAQREPSDAAVAANRARVEAWLASHGERDAADVRDGGRAAVLALLPSLPPEPGPARARLVRLLAEAGRAEHAVPALVPSWEEAAPRVPGDLAALLQATRYDEVLGWVRASAPDLGEAPWREATLGLSDPWLRRNPSVLQELADPRYAVRRDAFLRAVEDEESGAGPLLVGRALSDPAALLRREAVRVAAARGFSSLVAVGLADESWVVRRTAASSARALGEGAVPRLLSLLATDPVPEVRRAAAGALLDAAPADPRVVRAMVGTQAEEEATVRGEVALRWERLPRKETSVAVLAALDAEAARRAPRSGVLMRLFHALARTTGFDARYHPAMTRAELEAALARARRSAR